MKNVKSQKGSITVFVLVSCLLFIGCVVCVQINIQSKQVAMDREYMQIRENYETDTNSLDDIYNALYEEQQALEEERQKELEQSQENLVQNETETETETEEQNTQNEQQVVDGENVLN